MSGLGLGFIEINIVEVEMQPVLGFGRGLQHAAVVACKADHVQA